MKTLTAWLGIVCWFFFVISFLYTKHVLAHLPLEKDEGLPPSALNYLCDINSSTKGGSTRRDVVLFFATAYGEGLELAIRSLRSTGAKCRIILFTSKNFRPIPQFAKMVEALNIEIIPNCENTKKRDYVPHMIRFEFELEWLEKHSNEIDRVLHSDSFDVYFQGDPFANNIASDSLTFVVEPHCIRSCGWNLAWVRECYGGNIMGEMRRHFIVCSGSIAGGASDYIKLLKLMISQKEWEKCWQPSKDQPILNYLIWKGFVDKAGIKYSFTGCDGGYFTVQWCVLDKNIRFNEHNQIISLANSVPPFIHQYNRIDYLTDKLYRQCRLK